MSNRLLTKTEWLAALEELWEAAQQPRPWVGLTDEEMSDTVADMEIDFGDLLWKVVCLTKIIEAKLKERNT
jgi:NTP pyrophosphatase (non-canonical NTP hydrolase)